MADLNKLERLSLISFMPLQNGHSEVFRFNGYHVTLKFALFSLIKKKVV